MLHIFIFCGDGSTVIFGDGNTRDETTGTDVVWGRIDSGPLYNMYNVHDVCRSRNKFRMTMNEIHYAKCHRMCSLSIENF